MAENQSRHAGCARSENSPGLPDTGAVVYLLARMSSRVTVCAMIYDEHRWVAVSELSAAVAGQSRKPDRVIWLSAGESGLAAGVRRGLATGCDWLWLLDGGAVPE